MVRTVIVEQKSSQSGRRKTITRTFEHELLPSERARLDKRELNKHSKQASLISETFKRQEMSRYKGRVSARAIERDFPHVVETVVIKGGLGKTLDAMHEFHKLHGIEAHTGKGRRDKNGRDYIRWCFVNPGIAAKFASQFVGMK